VFYTALDAVESGFKTILIEDATRSIDDKNFLNAEKKLKEKNVLIIKSNSIFSGLNI
jgi:nicotinamidase-related amidase